MKIKIMLASLLFVCMSASADTSKVFALMDVGDTTATLDTYAKMTTVDGLAYRTAWKIIEPHDGVYDWSRLDAAFDVVKLRGKLLTLHLGVSSSGLPAWLYNLGMSTYIYTNPFTGASVTEPLPWDIIFMDRYAKLVSAISAHIKLRVDDVRLYAVSDGSPVGEMSLVGCRNGVMGTGPDLYSRDSYLTAWETTLNTHASDYSNNKLFISAPTATICYPDTDGKQFYTDVLTYAVSITNQTNVFAADLNALGSQRMTQVDTSFGLIPAFQMIWSKTGDISNKMRGTLLDAVCSGLGYGARYFEIYKADLSSIDPAIQSAIATARAGQKCI